MSILNTPTKATLREHPQLAELFQIVESRHLTDAEFTQYLAVVPENTDRVAAAQEVLAAESAVVILTIKQIFSLYPFSKYHEFPKDKCVRDVSYVSAYATQSMLMGDPDWFRDKLLIWLKTILQAFSYPVREERQLATPVQNLPFPEITQHADSLPKKRRAIYETYARLLMNYKAALSPEAFALVQPHLQLAVDILAAD